ncbi:MAG: 16S rRNA (cytosine(1402)-N(4))-methyltransferase [Verrucomicrobiales bacterium]|jgi:16S rRNA (cytosine1402-N4)-methyltransferase|nr:16S rRNA (cytosine(1402)-N(4))-methyltransferase [Verrucomicrobiales bacterium]
MEFYHQPIMPREILAALEPVKGKQIFDGTLGGGGHSEVFLERGAHVVGCDQDAEALEYAGRRLAQFGDCFLPVRGNFSDMDSLLRNVGIDRVDGILMDLGVSSHQLDEPSRGFSFRDDGPLDMRMDDRADFSARDLVNDWDEAEMIRIFRDYGEERRAVRAAKEIMKARRQKAIDTTLQLAEIIERAVPRVSGKHPATRVFQAIRLAVNRELEMLEAALNKSLEVLSEGGVLAIISFHSLEDRMVKRFMRRHSTPFIDRPEWPEPRENLDYCLALPSRRAISPSDAEIEMNPRARSAKLRVAVKLED